MHDVTIVCHKQNQHNSRSGNKTLQLFYNTSLMTCSIHNSLSQRAHTLREYYLENLHD